MASSIETTSTTTTLKNNGNTYLSVDTNDDVAITNTLTATSPTFVTPNIGAATVTSLNGGQLAGNRNIVYNGEFIVAQRGASYALTTSTIYGSVDRWAFIMASSAAGIANQVGDAPPAGFTKSLKLGRTAGSTLTNAIRMYQILETVDSVKARSKSYTLSFYAKAGANFSAASSNLSIRLSEGTGSDQSVTNLPGGSLTGYSEKVSTNQVITTSWVRYSFTGTFGGAMSQIGFGFFYTPAGTAGADDNVYITGVQLEEGSVATPFEHRSYGEELALCQRYYQQWGGNSNHERIGTGFNYNTAQARVDMVLPVTMRATPTLSTPDVTKWAVEATTGTPDCTAIALDQASPRVAAVNFTVASGLTVGQGIHVMASNDSAARLQLTAEL
jgi:hypothetical protein